MSDKKTQIAMEKKTKKTERRAKSADRMEFYAKEITKGAGGWTAVMSVTFEKGGHKANDAILTMFGGSDGGKAEAKRFSRLLNHARKAFLKGEDVAQEVQVENVGKETGPNSATASH